jgi:hypothetical protein
MDSRSRLRSTSAALLAVTLLVPPPALSAVEGLVRAQQAAPIVLFTSTEQIPLKTYAELMKTGLLRITSGSAKDIPTVADVSHFRCGLTGWEPKGVLVASEELFASDTAERRLLPIVTRPVGVSTVLARAVDLENPARIAELRRAVGVPEGGDKSYFFLILSSGGMTRFYPFRIATPK